MFEKQVAHFSQGASVLAVKKIAAFNSDLSPQRPLLVDQKLLHPVAPFYEWQSVSNRDLSAKEVARHTSILMNGKVSPICMLNSYVEFL